MDTSHVYRPVTRLAQDRGRRAALRSLGASGMALFAALGLADASASGPGKGGSARVQADRKRKKQRKKRGPASPAKVAFATRIEVSASSDKLQAAAGSVVNSFADCGEDGIVVSCGYQLGGDPSEFVNVIVNAVEPDPFRPGCNAFLLRTIEAGSTAGATIQAVAVCLA